MQSISQKTIAGPCLRNSEYYNRVAESIVEMVSVSIVKIDFLLFTISLFFFLMGLLLKDVAQSVSLIIAFLKYIPLFVLYVRHLRNNFSAFIPLLFALFLIALMVIGGQIFSISGLLVAIMVPVSLYVFSCITFTRKQIQIIQWMIFFAFLIYIAISLCFRSILNPNQVAFTFLILSLDIFICAYTNKKRGKNSVFLPVFVLSTLLLILYTESRTSLLVFLMLPFAFIFRKKVTKTMLILWIILILCLVYPFVYCLLAGDTALRASQDTTLMNQNIFSGREIIWSYVITELMEPGPFWFGGINTEWWGKSMHNSAIDIIVRYGVPSLVVLFFIVSHYFRRINSLVNNEYKSLLLLVLVTMIWGTNESGLFLGFSFFLFFPFCIIHSKNIPERSKVHKSKSYTSDNQ